MTIGVLVVSVWFFGVAAALVCQYTTRALEVDSAFGAETAPAIPATVPARAAALRSVAAAAS